MKNNYNNKDLTFSRFIIIELYYFFDLINKEFTNIKNHSAFM